MCVWVKDNGHFMLPWIWERFLRYALFTDSRRMLQVKTSQGWRKVQLRRNNQSLLVMKNSCPLTALIRNWMIGVIRLLTRKTVHWTFAWCETLCTPQAFWSASMVLPIFYQSIYHIWQVASNYAPSTKAIKPRRGWNTCRQQHSSGTSYSTSQNAKH